VRRSSQNTVLVYSPEEEARLREAVDRFVRLDKVYTALDTSNPDYDQACKVIEGGFTSFLEREGSIATHYVTISLAWSN
jgi:hypothetical protein